MGTNCYINHDINVSKCTSSTGSGGLNTNVVVTIGFVVEYFCVIFGGVILKRKKKEIILIYIKKDERLKGLLF
jgi:hypothetical protein